MRIIQLSSKSILAVLFIMINIVIPFYMLKGKQRLRFAFAALGISVIAIAAVVSVKSFRERYVTSLGDDLLAAKPGASTDPRLARWHLVAGVIKQHPIIGHGSGSETTLLHDEFYKAKMYSSFLARLNSHNQYLSFLVKSGIWGFLIYVVTLTYGFRIAFKSKDVVFISFLLVIAIVSLSENVLDADKGVMFYSLFFSFFLFSGLKKAIPVKIDTPKREYLDALATNSLAVTSY
jgi:O-antigen ligase